ncbi:hypothetical protein Tco_0016237 [Tanacetum coccineum]
MYLTASRPDIQFLTCLCARYQANPKESHLIVVKRIFRCNIDRKSTSSACQLLGGKLMCWSAKKQQSVAMSSAEAEYVVPIFCDNTSAIAISNNPVLHSRTKHIDIRYHFIKDHILKGDTELHFIPTQYQCVDIFTRPLDELTFQRLIVEIDINLKVDFTFDKITFTTNNEVALLYPLHPNQEYFKDLSDFISKCCLNEAFTRAPTQYKEYLSEFWYTTKTLEGSKVWVSTPTGRVRGYIVRPWFATIGYREENEEKGTLKKSCLPLRFLSLLLEHMMHEYENEELTINPTQVFIIHNLTLMPNQPEEPPFTDHAKAIFNLDVPVDSKAPKPSLQTEETEVSKSKTGQSEKDTQSSLTKEKSPSHPSPPTPVVGEMHKEAQQAAGGPTSLGATSEEGAHPQLSSGMSAFIIIEPVYLASFICTLRVRLVQISTPLIELKELLLNIMRLSERIRAKKHVRDMEIELPGDLKEIPTKLETFTSTISSLSSQVCHNGENASGATSMNVPSAGKATDSLAEGEKNTKDAEANLQKQLINLLGIEVVEQYLSKKLLFDKYCDKMLRSLAFFPVSEFLHNHLA